MAVIKSKNAKKYSIITFILLFFTKFLIADPNAAHGDIDIGQIIKATIAIKKIEKTKFIILILDYDSIVINFSWNFIT